MSSWRGSVAAALLAASVLLAGPAAAQSPFVQELRSTATQYHRDPAGLDRIRDGLVQAVKTDAHPDNFIALGHVWYLWGEVRATTKDDKVAAYDRGREAGKRAAELAPRNPAARFWYLLNTARWGQGHGVVRSLFLLPTIRAELDAIKEIDPAYVPYYAVAGNVLAEVPGFVGGDLVKAEETFRTGLTLDRHYTALRIGLAKVLIKRGRTDEARRELQAVLDEPRPRNLAEWTVKDGREARALLASIASTP